MNRNIAYSVIALALTSVMGCGSAQKIEKDRVAPLKTVAIIGFGLQQQRPNEAMDVVKALMADDDRMNGAPIAKPAPIAKKMYENLSTQLARSTGWNMLSADKITSNPTYRALFQERTKQPQMRPLVKRNVEAYTPDGIVEAYLLTTLSEADRTNLMRALGVDGVIIVTVNSDLVNDANVFQKMTAHGKFKREVGVRFSLYDLRGNDPIWFDGKTRVESQEGVDHGLGFASTQQLEDLSFYTAERVFKKLGESYKTL